MKKSTYAIIAFLLLIIVAETALLLALASTGEPREYLDPDWQYTDSSGWTADMEIDTISAEYPDTFEPATQRQGSVQVTVDVPMVLVMPDGSECALPLDGSTYATDTLIIVSRTHSLQVR